MRRFFGVWGAFFQQQVKSLLEYKMDFAIGMVAIAFQQIGSFLILFAVFTRITAIGGFSFDEMLLFFGYSQLLRGIDHVYNDNIWTVGWWRIRDGSFNLFLIRPMGVLTHAVMERVQFDGLGEVLLGTLIFAYAFVRLGLGWGPVDWVLFALFLVFGLAIYFAIKLLCASVAFWTVTSGELMTVAYEINGFTKYPLDIYKNAVLRWALTYVLPFAVVAYFPMVHFLRGDGYAAQILGWGPGFDGLVLTFTGLIAGISLALAYGVWRLGLRRYNSTGT